MPKEMHSLTCGMSRTTMTAFRLFAQAARCRTRNLQLHQHVIGRELAANLNTEYAGRNGLSHRCFSSSEPDRFQASLQETAALDQLIDMMLAAKSQEELGKIVTDNLLSYDQKFWIRVASRNDTAATPEDSQKLQSLATTTMRMVDALVKRTDTKVSDSGRLLESFLKAAADEKGEWELPLSPGKYGAMEQEVVANFHQVDESLLATAGAWMRKAANDKMDGMVTLLQQVLQIYAAKALTPAKASTEREPEEQLLDEILCLPEAQWVPKLKEAASAGKIGENSFLASIRKRMETIVLALPSGSNAQRIQAEYLKELEGRAGQVFKGQTA